MARIETVGRVEPAQFRPGRAAADRVAVEPAIPAGRALVRLEGGRTDEPARGAPSRIGRPDAGFVAQLLACTDPAHRPSRLERTRAAADLYAAAMRRTA